MFIATRHAVFKITARIKREQNTKYRYIISKFSTLLALSVVYLLFNTCVILSSRISHFFE